MPKSRRSDIEEQKYCRAAERVDDIDVKCVLQDHKRKKCFAELIEPHDFDAWCDVQPSLQKAGQRVSEHRERPEPGAGLPPHAQSRP